MCEAKPVKGLRNFRVADIIKLRIRDNQLYISRNRLTRNAQEEESLEGQFPRLNDSEIVPSL